MKAMTRWTGILVLLGVIAVWFFINPAITINFPVRWEKTPLLLQLPISQGFGFFVALIWFVGYVLFMRLWALVKRVRKGEAQNEIGSHAFWIALGITASFICALMAGTHSGVPENDVQALARIGAGTILILMGGTHFVISM